MLPGAQSITWIKVERPTFDLAGVVLGSLGIAGICAVLAVVLGVVLGVAFILRRRRHPASWASEGLHLLDLRRP